MEPVGRDGKRYCRARRDSPANIATCPLNKRRAATVILFLIKMRHTPQVLDPNHDCLANLFRCRICVDRQTLGTGAQRARSSTGEIDRGLGVDQQTARG